MNTMKYIGGQNANLLACELGGMRRSMSRPLTYVD